MSTHDRKVVDTSHVLPVKDPGNITDDEESLVVRAETGHLPLYRTLSYTLNKTTATSAHGTAAQNEGCNAWLEPQETVTVVGRCSFVITLGRMSWVLTFSWLLHSSLFRHIMLMVHLAGFVSCRHQVDRGTSSRLVHFAFPVPAVAPPASPRSSKSLSTIYDLGMCVSHLASEMQSDDSRTCGHSCVLRP